LIRSRRTGRDISPSSFLLGARPPKGRLWPPCPARQQKLRARAPGTGAISRERSSQRGTSVASLFAASDDRSSAATPARRLTGPRWMVVFTSGTAQACSLVRCPLGSSFRSSGRGRRLPGRQVEGDFRAWRTGGVVAGFYVGVSRIEVGLWNMSSCSFVRRPPERVALLRSPCAATDSCDRCLPGFQTCRSVPLLSLDLPIQIAAGLFASRRVGEGISPTFS
jgi:hypothetical protein